jgi:hypothetical protein
MTIGNSDAPWSRKDIFFLIDALERRMSLVAIAAFLGRTEDEVREKSKEVARKQGSAAPKKESHSWDGHYYG